MYIGVKQSKVSFTSRRDLIELPLLQDKWAFGGYCSSADILWWLVFVSLLRQLDWNYSKCRAVCCRRLCWLETRVWMFHEPHWTLSLSWCCLHQRAEMMPISQMKEKKSARKLWVKCRIVALLQGLNVPNMFIALECKFTWCQKRNCYYTGVSSHTVKKCIAFLLAKYQWGWNKMMPLQLHVLLCVALGAFLLQTGRSVFSDAFKSDAKLSGSWNFVSYLLVFPFLRY